MRSAYLAIFVALSGIQLRAQSNMFWVPPWFSHNSVIQEVNRDAAKVRQLLLSLRSRIPGEIEITSPLWSGRRIHLEKAQSQTFSEWSTWELANNDLRSGQLSRLVPGVPFEIVITRTGKGTDELRLTNMVMGQVWLLAVSPDRDSLEMPQLSPSALDWIRVLPLDGIAWTSMTGRWISAREAVEKNERLFCGLPRGFANELLKSEVNRLMQRPIGLVLVSSKAERPLSGKWRNLVNRAKSSDAEETQFAAAVNAAAAAVEGAVNEGTGRFVRAKDKQTARNIDLKREGQLGDYSVPEPAVWQSMAEGEHVPLPMRVSGLFW